MIQVLTYIQAVFNTVINQMREWEILPGVSLLTFHITVFIIGLLFSVLLNIVRSESRYGNNKERNPKENTEKEDRNDREVH